VIRKETLKDRTKVIMKYFPPKDLNKIIKFYINLLPTGEFGDIIRIIAIHGEDIVADGALELLFDEQHRHDAELRVIVAKRFRHRGLGTIMMKELS
jgi:hypothetical protein